MSITQLVLPQFIQKDIVSEDAAFAEAAVMLRLAGYLSEFDSKLACILEFASHTPAKRFADLARYLFGVECRISAQHQDKSRKAPLIQCIIEDKVYEIIKKLGYLNHRNRPILGLPPKLISYGSREMTVPALRGGILARGIISDPKVNPIVDISCPNEGVALAFVGLSRKIGVTAKVRDIRGRYHMSLRDADQAAMFLKILGARELAERYEKRAKADAEALEETQVLNFVDANIRRSSRAAGKTALRVERALKILGDNVPAHLREAGVLRMEDREASLEELAMRTEERITKDAIAGRIRRLIGLADKRAKELGIEGTALA